MSKQSRSLWSFHFGCETATARWEPEPLLLRAASGAPCFVARVTAVGPREPRPSARIWNIESCVWTFKKARADPCLYHI